MGGRFGEIILLFILVLLLFGPNKLPDMAKSIGQALNEFKKAANPEVPNPQPQPQPAAMALPAPAAPRRRRKVVRSRTKSKKAR